MTRFAVLLLGFLFVGCGTVPPADIDNGTRFLSLTPASLGRNLNLSQLVTGNYAGKIYRARYEVEIAGDRLAIVGLSPVGLTLFTLVQQGSEVSVDSRLGEALGVDPRYTLFDIYLAYWPESALGPALKKIGMTLEIFAGGDTRIVRDGRGRWVATVTYPGNVADGEVIEIEHFDRPYTLRITPIRAPGGR